MRITVEKILSLGPCSHYREHDGAVIRELWAGRKSLTPAEIAALNIPPTDRAWALMRLVSRNARVAWACDCASRALPVFEAWAKRTKQTAKIAQGPRKCIKTVRAWLHGKATITEVREARDASYAATYTSYAAANEAAYAAAYAAYDAAAAANEAAYAAAAARAKFWTWALARLVEYVEGRRKP